MLDPTKTAPEALALLLDQARELADAIQDRITIIDGEQDADPANWLDVGSMREAVQALGAAAYWLDGRTEAELATRFGVRL